MRDDYKMEGPKKKFEIEIEAIAAARLEEMALHTRFTLSELANTAIKRFIATHKDFLPESKSANRAS